MTPVPQDEVHHLLDRSGRVEGSVDIPNRNGVSEGPGGEPLCSDEVSIDKESGGSAIQERGYSLDGSGVRGLNFHLEGEGARSGFDGADVGVREFTLPAAATFRV